MTYNPSTPGPNDIVSETQSLIQDNFTVLNDDFDINHYNYTAASNNGKHRQVTLPENSSPTATAASEINVYSSLFSNTGGASADAYVGVYQKENNGPVGAFTPFAYGSVLLDGTLTGTITQGFNVNSPATAPASNRRTIQFTTAAPSTNYLVFLTLYSVNLPNTGSDVSIVVKEKLVDSFTITSSNTRSGDVVDFYVLVTA